MLGWCLENDRVEIHLRVFIGSRCLDLQEEWCDCCDGERTLPKELPHWKGCRVMGLYSGAGALSEAAWTSGG